MPSCQAMERKLLTVESIFHKQRHKKEYKKILSIYGRENPMTISSIFGKLEQDVLLLLYFIKLRRKKLFLCIIILQDAFSGSSNLGMTSTMKFNKDNNGLLSLSYESGNICEGDKRHKSTIFFSCSKQDSVSKTIYIEINKRYKN